MVRSGFGYLDENAVPKELATWMMAKIRDNRRRPKRSDKNPLKTLVKIILIF